MARNYRAELERLVDQFLAGRLDFDSFQEEYSRLFIDDMPDAALDADELDYFGRIHERSEWTAVNPPASDRKDGWWDIADFHRWLAEQRAKEGGA